MTSNATQRITHYRQLPTASPSAPVKIYVATVVPESSLACPGRGKKRARRPAAAITRAPDRPTSAVTNKKSLYEVYRKNGAARKNVPQRPTVFPGVSNSSDPANTAYCSSRIAGGTGAGAQGVKSEKWTPRNRRPIGAGGAPTNQSPRVLWHARRLALWCCNHHRAQLRTSAE